MAAIRIIASFCQRCRKPFSYTRALKAKGRFRDFCDPCIPLRAIEIEKSRPQRKRDAAEMRASRARRKTSQEGNHAHPA